MKIVYNDLAVGAKEDAEFTLKNQSDFSQSALLKDGGDMHPAITLEHNQWGLNAEHTILHKPQAFWSAAISDVAGNFTDPPMITVLFDAQYTSTGITLAMGESTDSWCATVNIKWYRGGELLSNMDFKPNKPHYFCENAVIAYNKIEITIKSTSLPYHYARINQVIFGVTRVFLDDEIRSGTALIEISPTSQQISTNTLDWTLDSADYVKYIFQKKQTMYCYDKNTLIGVFYIDNSTQHSRTVYDISCIDAIGTLEQSRFTGGYYQGKNAFELITEICAPFVPIVADSLKLKVVSGIIMPCTRREALQQVCFAICAIADTSGTETVRVYPMQDGGGRIPEDRVFWGGSLHTYSITTSVTVISRSFAEVEPSEEVEYDTYELGGKKYYGIRKALTKKNPLIVSTDIPNDILFEECTLITDTNAQEVLDNIYSYYNKRVTHNFDAVLGDELPGNIVTVPTFADDHTGMIESMKIRMSNLTVAEYRVRGDG